MTTRRLVAPTAAALTASLAMMLASTVLSSHAARAATPDASFGRAFALRLPANSAAAPGGIAWALSCSSFGDCVAGGDYTDIGGNSQPFAVTENSGKWSRGVELRLPTDAPDSLSAKLTGLSCTRLGDCSAVGDYPKANAALGRIFAITEANGRWHRATELKLPSNAASPPQAQLYAVSCWAPGWCLAVGGYWDSANNPHAAMFAESNGSWHRGIEVLALSDAGPHPRLELHALACQHGGQCAIAGDYLNTAGHRNIEGLVVSNGSFLTVASVKPPRNATGSFLEITSASCASSTKCVVVGEYEDKSGEVQPLSMVESDYAFPRSATQVAAVPPHEQSGALYAISCTAKSLCVAVGAYTDATNHNHAYAVTRSATGHWGNAAIVQNPPGALAVTGPGGLNGISCSAKGCAAAGFYEIKAGPIRPMAAIEP